MITVTIPYKRLDLGGTPQVTPSQDKYEYTEDNDAFSRRVQPVFSAEPRAELLHGIHLHCSWLAEIEIPRQTNPYFASCCHDLRPRDMIHNDEILKASFWDV